MAGVKALLPAVLLLTVGCATSSTRQIENTMAVLSCKTENCLADEATRALRTHCPDLAEACLVENGLSCSYDGDVRVCSTVMFLPFSDGRQRSPIITLHAWPNHAETVASIGYFTVVSK